VRTGRENKAASLFVFLGVLAAGWACPLQARAALSFGDWSWMLTPVRHGRHYPPQEISRLDISAGTALPGRLAANLALKNSGADREGILLRYDLSAEVYSVSDPQKERGWTIPFVVDERRVPQIKSGQSLNVSFDVTEIVKDYFKQLFLEGWRPKKIKMEIMIEPRQGEDSALKKTEATLPIFGALKSRKENKSRD
jgi:hypothetical protein